MQAADHTLIEDLAILRALAIEAGALAMRFKKAKRETLNWKKTGGSPVTEADIAVNNLCAARLGAARPHYGWLSEETADVPARRQKQRCWVVDPIDGTRAYMRDDPNWCVGLAIVEDGRSVAGVLYAPELGALYEAREGGGAFLNGEVISASSCSAEEDCRLITHEGMVTHKSWPTPWPRVTLAKPSPNATLLRLAFVADGTWDAAIALSHKSDWDLAAGNILVQEAGGVSSTHKGEPFAFNRHVPVQRSLIAAGKQLHPLLVQRLVILDIADPQDPNGSSIPTINKGVT